MEKYLVENVKTLKWNSVLYPFDNVDKNHNKTHWMEKFNRKYKLQLAAPREQTQEHDTLKTVSDDCRLAAFPAGLNGKY